MLVFAVLGVTAIALAGVCFLAASVVAMCEAEQAEWAQTRSVVLSDEDL